MLVIIARSAYVSCSALFRMYGVTTIQTLAFFRLYKQDPCWLKGTVGFIIPSDEAVLTHLTTHLTGRISLVFCFLLCTSRILTIEGAGSLIQSISHS